MSNIERPNAPTLLPFQYLELLSSSPKHQAHTRLKDLNLDIPTGNCILLHPPIAPSEHLSSERAFIARLDFMNEVNARNVS